MNMKTGILIGYFSKQDEAMAAFKNLRRKGFRRAALVSKNDEGQMIEHDPFRRTCVIWTSATFLLLSLIAIISSMTFHWSAARPVVISYTAIAAAISGIIGALSSIFWVTRKRFGVNKKLIAEHARWLFTDETVLIFQGPIENLSTPFNLLLESGETPPALFALHPHYDIPQHNDSNQIPAPMTISELQEHAKRLASGHQISENSIRNKEPLNHLELNRKWTEKVCQSLSEANKLQQTMPPAAEWLLDNEYMLESAARDVQKNLPLKFYKELPSLSSGKLKGLPRIYSLARHLVFHTDMRLDEESILAFIESYQTTNPLSIGELWVVPQMLRCVLLEGIAQIASRTMDDLREHEMADFWANRLITANRRDPNYIFSIMSELSKSRKDPSHYFATQLIDYLYDEGNVLGAVQSWLERTFHKNTAELGQQVTSRQTKDQLSIGNAFGSLRQLSLLDWKKCFERASVVEHTLSDDPSDVYAKMDFSTRNRYRHAIEDLRRRSRLSENEIATCAIEMASKSAEQNPHDLLGAHVGTYLIGGKREQLAKK